MALIFRAVNLCPGLQAFTICQSLIGKFFWLTSAKSRLKKRPRKRGTPKKKRKHQKKILRIYPMYLAHEKLSALHTLPRFQAKTNGLRMPYMAIWPTMT